MQNKLQWMHLKNLRFAEQTSVSSVNVHEVLKEQGKKAPGL